MGGCKISYESNNFYATYGSVKKKLGDSAYTLPSMNVYGHGSSTTYNSSIYLPLRGASNISFGFSKNNYGKPSAVIHYVDGSAQTVFSLDRGVLSKSYSVTITKEASYIHFSLPNDSTVTDYWINNFTVS